MAAGLVEGSATSLTNGKGGLGYFGEKAFLSSSYQIEDGRYGIPFAGDFHAHGHAHTHDPGDFVFPAFTGDVEDGLQVARYLQGDSLGESIQPDRPTLLDPHLLD